MGLIEQRAAEICSIKQITEFSGPQHAPKFKRETHVFQRPAAPAVVEGFNRKKLKAAHSEQSEMAMAHWAMDTPWTRAQFVRWTIRNYGQMLDSAVTTQGAAKNGSKLTIHGKQDSRLAKTL